MKILALCCTVFMLSSCAFHAAGWQSNDRPGSNTASFHDFDGKDVKTIHVEKEALLVVSYAATLTQGALHLSVANGKHTIWQKDISGQGDTAELQFGAAEAGTYHIIATGKKAGGTFDITYKAVAPKKIQVATNKNIELFGLLMQLDAGASLVNNTDTVLIENKRTTWRDWYALTWENYLRYKAFDSSSMLQLYRTYSGSGFTDDFFIGFLLQVTEVPYAKISTATDKETIMPFSKTGDMNEAAKNATAFLELFNRFYNDVHFENYLAENKTYYHQIKTDVEKNLPSAYFLPTMETFYQKEFSAYYLVPSLNIPTSMGFGKMNHTTKTVYNTFGPFSFQSFDSQKPVLAFDYPDRIQGLSVHEFGHSFVNPAIDKLPKTLIDSTAILYAPIKEEMSKRAYTSWMTCLYEHFVKAGEVLIARKLGKDKEAATLLDDNVKAKFIYLPLIVKELDVYDKNKKLYPSYDDFVLRVMRTLQATIK